MGKGGGKTIERFLEKAPQHLLSNGIVYLGVNGFHIKRKTIENFINHSNFLTHSVSRNWWNGSVVYVLQSNFEVLNESM